MTQLLLTREQIGQLVAQFFIAGTFNRVIVPW